MTSVLDHRKHHHDDHHQQQQQILERDSSVNELLSPSSEAVHQGEEEQSALVTNRVSRGGGATGKEMASESFSESILQTLKVGFYFGLWYALNIVYNSKSSGYPKRLWGFFFPLLILFNSQTSFLSTCLLYPIIVTVLSCYSREQEGLKCTSGTFNCWFYPIWNWSSLCGPFMDASFEIPTKIIRFSSSIDHSYSGVLALYWSVVQYG